MTPSTEWKEVITADEPAQLEALASQLAAMQAALMAKRGNPQRALHAKANAVARGRFEVHAGLPELLRVGLFAEPRAFDAVVRFSNGGPHVQADKKPDVRGVAVKLLGVTGEKCIPGFAHDTQDFLGILSSATPFRSPDEFIFFVLNAASPLTLVPKAAARFGLGRTLKLLGALQKELGAKSGPLHGNRYFSALPMRFGAHAAKFCFTPEQEPAEAPAKELGAQFSLALSAGALKWRFQVQLFVDEATTPIEDPTVEWTSPWHTVATLTLPQQTTTAAFADWVETLSFDPWHAQAELRPLGAMMRARNAAYRLSTKARAAAGEPTALPPEFQKSA